MLLETPGNYENFISNQIKGCKNVWSAIAYVTESGISIFLKDLEHRDFQLICNTELGSESFKAIKTLLSKCPKSKVKICNPTIGKFHPKLWIFGSKSNKPTSVVIGSANLTYSAMRRNIEIGAAIDNSDVVRDSHKYFGKMWRGGDVSELKLGDALDALIKGALEMENGRKRLYKSGGTGQSDSVKRLVEFTNSWVRIPKMAKIGGVSIWRGWYIVPDQGLVDDGFVQDLVGYLSLINGIVDIRESSVDANWRNILSRFKASVAGRSGEVTSDRELFVRQCKNFLIKFGWVKHYEDEFGKVDIGRIMLTPIGEEVRDARNLDEVRDIYTDYFMKFEFFGLEIVSFLFDLLGYVEYITHSEMECFVIHAFSKNDLKLMVNLIEIYRGLDDEGRKEFHDEFKVAFKKHKEYTAKSVFSNYRKKVEHTVRVIAWCKPFYLDGKTIRLQK